MTVRKAKALWNGSLKEGSDITSAFPVIKFLVRLS